MFKYICTVLFLTILISPAGVPKTIRVPDDFQTIRSAVEVAGTDDIVIVAPGKYREDIEFKKGIYLQGAGAHLTNLTGAITVKNVSGVTIDGFTIEGQGRDAHFGIWCSSSSLTVSNNVITGYHHGIGSESSRIIIENNSVLRNFNAGIQIQTAIAGLIRGNIVNDNVDAGIRIAMSEDRVVVIDNVIAGNRVGIECVQSAPKIRRNVIEGNKIGVASVQDEVPDMGRDGDPGLNVIKNNGLQVANMERGNVIQAKYNYWGTSIGPDTSSFDGKVDYIPWLEADPLKAQSVKSPGKLAVTWGRIRQDGR